MREPGGAVSRPSASTTIIFSFFERLRAIGAGNLQDPLGQSAAGATWELRHRLRRQRASFRRKRSANSKTAPSAASPQPGGGTLRRGRFFAGGKTLAQQKQQQSVANRPDGGNAALDDSFQNENPSIEIRDTSFARLYNAAKRAYLARKAAATRATRDSRGPERLKQAEQGRGRTEASGRRGSACGFAAQASGCARWASPHSARQGHYLPGPWPRLANPAAWAPRLHHTRLSSGDSPLESDEKPCRGRLCRGRCAMNPDLSTELHGAEAAMPDRRFLLPADGRTRRAAADRGCRSRGGRVAVAVRRTTRE